MNDEHCDLISNVKSRWRLLNYILSLSSLWNPWFNDISKESVEGHINRYVEICFYLVG